MVDNRPPPIYINGVKFQDVTNVTTSGKIYTKEEAIAYTKGSSTTTSG